MTPRGRVCSVHGHSLREETGCSLQKATWLLICAGLVSEQSVGEVSFLPRLLCQLSTARARMRCGAGMLGRDFPSVNHSNWDGGKKKASEASLGLICWDSS